MEERKSSNRLLTTLVIILVIAVLGLTGFIVYDKVLKKEKTDPSVENNRGDNESTVTVSDYFYGSYDRKSFNVESKCIVDSESGPVYGKDSVRIPKIDSEKPGAKEINNLIVEQFGKYTKLDESLDWGRMEGNVSTSITIDYDYKISNGYLSILVSYSAGASCMTGSYYNSSFVYDINNDKYLKNADLLNVYNVSKTDLIEKTIEDIEKMIIEPESIKNDYIDAIKEQVNDDDYYAYIDDKGQLVVQVLWSPWDSLTYTFE